MKYLYIFAFFLASLGGVYGVGHRNGYAQSQAEITAQVAKANAEARDTEQKLNAQVADLTTQLVKVQTQRVHRNLQPSKGYDKWKHNNSLMQ